MTAMRRWLTGSALMLAALLSSAACSASHSTTETETEVPPSDGGVVPNDAAPSAPLACGSTTCTSGEVCVLRHGGADGGRPPTPRCEPLPAACTTLSDCASYSAEDCCEPRHRCARLVCGIPDTAWCGGYLVVSGRHVTCGGA